jgi:Kef-type K+ transport system membrane component KefB
MTLLMCVALAGYLISYRINQSAVVGIILAGIVVGPSLLDWVNYTSFVSTMANLGAIVMLFTIGLEFEIKEIAKVKYLIIAIFGVLVPVIGGFFVAEAFDFDFKASIFIGTALTATSIAITANVLREMGKLQTEAAKAIIGAAVIDDILGLMALSVSEGLVSGDIAITPILFALGKAVAFIVLGWLLGQFVLRKLVVRLDKTKIGNMYPESIFIFTMMIAFLYAMAAEFVGLSGIVGSFLAGASFAKVALGSGKIFKEGAHHLQIIFASIFFISLGVIFDIHALTWNLVLFIAILTLVALLTKFIGCGVPAKLAGLSWNDSTIIGLGMAPRGEVAMIVALIGLNQGLINQGAYASLILMSLLTTVIPPLLFRNLLFKAKKTKRKTTVKAPEAV